MQKPGICPFLHGPQTDKSTMNKLENAFKEQISEHVEVVLYKKNLTPLCILVEVIPIRNDENLIVLFLITFRDLTAFRQPLKEESAQTSALGAFAAASDAGSSWGKFARLVFSMVRQKVDDSIEDNLDQVESPQLKIENETVCSVKQKSNDKPQQQLQQYSTGSEKNVISVNELSNDNNTNISNTNDNVELIIPLTQQNQQLTTKSCHHSSLTDHVNNITTEMNSGTYSKSLNKLESGEFNLTNLEIKSKKDKYNLFKKRNNRKSNNTLTNSKKLGNKCVTINGDIDDLLSNQWSAPESIPRYRPEPPCPPKHVLLHYSVFRIVWDWTILLLTGYTAIIVPLRVAVIPRPTWVSSTDSLTVQGSSNKKDWIHPTTLELLTFTDAIIDIIFGVDIVLNFHTSFVGAGGEVVADPPVIRMNYLSGWFTLDLLACLPYEILKYCWPVDNIEIYYLMDGLRIVRLLRIGRAARRIDQYLEYVSTLLLLMILCFFLLAHWFACAWYAVGIYDLENKIYYGWIPRIYNDSLKPQNWEDFTLSDHSLTVSMMNLNKTQLFSQHITSIHHSLLNSNVQSIPSSRTSSSSSKSTSSSSSSATTTTTSSIELSITSNNHFINSTKYTNCSINRTCIDYLFQNDTMNAEQEHNQHHVYHTLSTNFPLQNSRDKWTAYITALYFSLSLLTTIGFALVYATIFGNVTTIVQQMYATRTRYNEMMKGVKDFLKIHEVPRELGERVIDYITSSWSVTKGIDTVKVLNYCPKDMQADISVHLNRCVFNSHAAFRLASDGCRRSLAVNFQTLHTAPGDLICHQGESVDQLCFIASGTLEVLQDDEVIAILGKGDVFGDPLWRNTVSVPAAASVRALTYCTLHTIRLDRLRIVLNFYHAFANSFTRNLELTYNLCNRVIFRKLSDVKREMELSMRRNKEPPLSTLPASHPVRKLISRLRRSSQVGDLSSRQYLGTIVSCHTSLDGSEFENSSISDIVINSAPDKSASLCKSPLPYADNEANMSTNNHSKIVTPLSSPVKLLHKNSIDSQPQTEPPPVVSTSLGKGPNPARKWARLISKATQPPLHNLNEEPNEDSTRVHAEDKQRLSETQLNIKSSDDHTFASIPISTVSSIISSQNPTINSIQTPILHTLTTNSTDTTLSVPYQDLHRIELNIEKHLNNFHLQLSQQINEIVKRLNNLEGQIVELRNTLPNSMNTTLVTTSKFHDSLLMNNTKSITINSNNNNNSTSSNSINHHSMFNK
ncbi:Potassium voltage-gated channel protein eag [Schistosoma japonicum]|nr:Potassium voltage-gated channel protein eag [Schistosoma japonicum]